MRLLLFGTALGLAACSGLPPEPLIPLTAGEVALGVTVDVSVSGEAPAGLSIWGAVGADRGVDVAFSADAPFSIVSEWGALGRGDRPFLPPGLAVRKSYPSGLGVGVGVASRRTALEPVPPHRGLIQLTAGPFVSFGSPDAEEPFAGRASAHLVYEVRVARPDSVAVVRRGLALYGVGAAGPIVRSDSGFVVLGGRVLAGTWLRSPTAGGVTVGPFAEAYEAGRPLAER